MVEIFYKLRLEKYDNELDHHYIRSYVQATAGETCLKFAQN